MVNLGNMMKQAQELQKKMAEAQNKLNEIEVEGTSGGGDVKMVLNGDGEIQSLFISDKLFKEDKSLIEDLVIAAHNNAKNNLKSKTSDELSKVTGGFGIPGFKWPL